MAKAGWPSWKCASGRADAIPQMIESLGADDAHVRKSASRQLRQQLVGDHEWFSAAPRAVPLLVEKLAAPSPDRHRVLALLANLVIARQPTFFAHGLDRRQPEIKKRYARGSAKEVHGAVLKSADRYLELLSDDDARIRSAAALARACLPEASERALPTLAEGRAHDSDSFARANFVLSSTFAARDLGQRELVLPELRTLIEEKDAVVAGAAALACASLAGEVSDAWAWS